MRKIKTAEDLKNVITPIVVMVLVGLSILANAPQRLPYSPKSDLSRAAFENDVEKAKALIQNGTEVNAKDSGASGWVPLHFASAMGKIEMIALLLDKGADINIRDNAGRTPLHATGLMSQTDAAVDLLVKRGANVNATDNEGKTPLQSYIDDKKYIESKSIDTLLKAGADPTIKDKSGHSAYDDAKSFAPELSRQMEKYMHKKK